MCSDLNCLSEKVGEVIILQTEFSAVNFSFSVFHFTESTLSLAMVLTTSQTTTFFEDKSQMSMSNRTQVDSLQLERILTAADLSDWEDDDQDQCCLNCKNPDRIQDPAAGAAVGDLINQVPFSVPVRFLNNLKIVSCIVRY